MKNDKSLVAGSVITAGLASLCCIGPIVFGGLGATAVALGAKFEILRPYFLTLTGIFLSLPKSKPRTWVQSQAVFWEANYRGQDGVKGDSRWTD